MALRSAEDYIESIASLRREVRFLGEKITDTARHPAIRPSLNAVAETYRAAAEADVAGLATATSSVTGEVVNRFTHLHRSTEDLVNKVKLQRLLGSRTACCFQRCVGMDAINAVEITTFEMDGELGTSYHERFLNFLARVQARDQVVEGAMTDPKGDRGKRPSEQAHPDAYLHCVEQRSNGIVVRGAKFHQTGALNSHEILVMPTVAMREDERAYAVCFAVPSDIAGLVFVLGRQPSDTRKQEAPTSVAAAGSPLADLDLGNATYGGHECAVIFDDVFVPWERVFMFGETAFTGRLVERFASYHRQSYGGCKVGVGDVLIGAAALAAEYQGVAQASHIRDKLTEMVALNETMYCCGVACSHGGRASASGTYLVDTLLANVCKLNVTRFPYELARLAQDIAGGLVVTMPSAADLCGSPSGEHLLGLFQGCEGVQAEQRLRIIRLIENLTLGPGAAAYLTESMHGAGSPQAQKVVIARQGDLEVKKRAAARVAGLRRLD